VFHVLHRHLAPRHPPHALSSLDYVMRRTRSSSDAAIQLLRCAPRMVPRGSDARPLGPQPLAERRRDGRSNRAWKRTGPTHRRAATHGVCAGSRLIPFAGSLPSSVFPHTTRSGGDEGIRTPDLCFAKAALSQLSYIPVRSLSCQPRLHLAPQRRCKCQRSARWFVPIAPFADG
jgi:hypothetical protein